MQLFSIETGRFRLDGGAMFGVVPKPLWSKTNPADDRNRIDLAMRALLILHPDGRVFLVDNGLGNKYNDKFADLYAMDARHTLDASLAAHGLHREAVTDLILTHLHFDHCGGTTAWNASKDRFEVQFPNARIHLQRKQLEWAQTPNAREVASFFADENIHPIAEWDGLVLHEGEVELAPGISLRLAHGHTESQQLPLITLPNGKRILYAADLFPTFGHIPLPYVMGYDTRPLLTLEERAKFLDWIVDEDITLFYEHDPYNEVGRVERTTPGKFRSGETGILAALMG